MVGRDCLNEKKKIDVIVIVGPTACGKTSLSISLAKILNAEIISADSMQIYKGMNIGTAKPTKEEMQGVPHHLIDFVDIDKEFSVAEYVKLAKSCIFDIDKRGKIPIVVGGTGLYINSLINDVHFIKQPSDPELRESLKERVEKEGIEALIAELKSFDKESAERLHPNNVGRIIRAIEIYRTTGITMSQQIENSKKVQSPYNPIMIGINYKDRDVLYDRINKRVDSMIDNGLVEEARRILSSNCSKTAMNAICYKELIPYINGQCSLCEAVENLKMQTRRYAKRQITWFKKNNRINWFFADNYIDFKEFFIFCTKNYRQINKYML